MDGIVDARFTTEDSKKQLRESHSTYFRGDTGVADSLMRRFLPRPAERTVIRPGTIVIEAFSRVVSHKKVVHIDPFDGMKQSHGLDHAYSGHRLISWTQGGCDPKNPVLRSNYDPRYDQDLRGKPDDERRMREDLGMIPGMAVCLDKERCEGLVIDLLDLNDPETEELWERWRRRAYALHSSHIIPFPGGPDVISFRSRDGQIDIGRMAAWEWCMRQLLDSNYSNSNEEITVCRPYLNCDDLRTKRQLAESGEVELSHFVDPAVMAMVKADLMLRNSQLPKPADKEDLYAWTSKMTPELCGVSEVVPDYSAVVVNPYRI